MADNSKKEARGKLQQAASNCSKKSTSGAKIHALTTAIILFSTTQLLLTPIFVHCQDFEDLTSKQQQQQQQQQNTFPATFSRQPQAPVSISSSSSLSSAAATAAAIAGNRQRPLLSNRFSPGSANNQQQQQQLLAQPTQNAPSFSSLPTTNGAATSNIEQMMKNALARTTQLNAAAASVAAEPRLDSFSPGSSATAEQQPQQQPQPQQSRTSQQQQSPVNQQQASGREAAQSSDRQAESSEFSASSTSSADSSQGSQSDNDNKQTTLPATGQTDTTAGHETVYGDQRFANLFARRNNARKAAKFQPSEPLKAKPTLPSFIKSPPDPKQFSAIAAQAFSDGVPGTRGQAPASSSLGSSNNSQRQQQQNRANLLANQQATAAAAKKAAITSNSAANANNKRANANLANANLANRATATAPNATSGPRAAASNSKPLVTSRPAAAAAAAAGSPNPFSRNQAASSQDPANVIAMARKRLLANNALESAKLKQQQAAKPATN